MRDRTFRRASRKGEMKDEKSTEKSVCSLLISFNISHSATVLCCFCCVGYNCNECCHFIFHYSLLGALDAINAGSMETVLVPITCSQNLLIIQVRTGYNDETPNIDLA